MMLVEAVVLVLRFDQLGHRSVADHGLETEGPGAGVVFVPNQCDVGLKLETDPIVRLDKIELAAFGCGVENRAAPS